VPMVEEMPRQKRNDLTVKIDAALVAKAKSVSGFRGLTLAEYLSEKLRGPVEKDFDTFIDEQRRVREKRKDH
jgi:hypothetical protein